MLWCRRFIPASAGNTIGNGVVLDVHHLLAEVRGLEAGGIKVRERLKISPGCPIILGYHSAVDRAREAKKSAGAKIGTTGKGIGPTYEDKVARRALRVYDLFDPKRFAEKLAENLEYHNFVLTQYLGADPVDFQTVFDEAMADAEEIRPMVTDVSADLYAINKAGGNLLFEGAQGTLLDIMLVLPDTDAFRINLDQLGKRVHQATADTDGATDRHVIFGKLVAGYLGCGIDGCSVLTDHEHLYFAIIADIGNELFRLAACSPVPDSDGVNGVCGYQLCYFGCRFAFFVLGRVRIDRFIM